MNIGIVCYPTYGGSGVIATELGKGMAKRGHKVHFITSSKPVRLGHYEANIFYHQVSAANYPLFNFIPYESALISKIVEVVQYEKVDVLHVHYAIPHASAAYFARQILNDLGTKLPYITTLHGTDITLVGTEKSYRPVVCFSINQSDAVTSVSEYLKQETLKNFNISVEINVIPNFLELERFRNPKVKTWPFCPNHEKVLTHVSNFRKVKRVYDLLAIFKSVNAQIPTKLLLIGDGPERAGLEHEVRVLGLQDSIIFLGEIDVVEEILPQADLFLMPSENESFGLSALEAMACGLPVIGTNSGGMPEVVEHGVSGYLTGVGDTELMAKFVIELLENNQKKKQFSIAAKKKANLFAVDKIIPLYESLYYSVVQKYKYV